MKIIKKKKSNEENAVPGNSLNALIDSQINVLVISQSEEALPMEDAFALDISQQESALLAISRDLQTVLMSLGIVRVQIQAFESFARSLQNQIAILRGAAHE